MRTHTNTTISEDQLTRAGQYRWTIPRSTLPARLPATIIVTGRDIPRAYTFHLSGSRGRTSYSCPYLCDTISTVCVHI